jgi:hypothetical protein
VNLCVMVSCLPFYSSRGGQVTILEKEGEKRDVSERYNVKKRERWGSHRPLLVVFSFDPAVRREMMARMLLTHAPCTAASCRPAAPHLNAGSGELCRPTGHLPYAGWAARTGPVATPWASVGAQSHLSTLG